MRAYLRRHGMSKEAVEAMNDKEVETGYRRTTVEHTPAREWPLGTTVPPAMGPSGTNVTTSEDEFADSDDDYMRELERSCIQILEECDGEWDDHGSQVSLRLH